MRAVAIFLLFVVGLNALAAGFSFIVDPDGHSVGISTDYLRDSGPFKDFFVPGLLLFFFNGMLSILVAVFTFKKTKHHELLIILQGCIITGWIGIQLSLVTALHILHLIIASIGFTLILLGWSLARRNAAAQLDV